MTVNKKDVFNIFGIDERDLFPWSTGRLALISQRDKSNAPFAVITVKGNRARVTVGKELDTTGCTTIKVR